MVSIPTAQRQHLYTQPQEKVNALGAAASALLPAAKEYKQTLVNQQRVKIDTESTKARVEIDNLVNQWQLQNQARPDDPEARAQLKSDIQDILNRHGSQIDPVAKMDWDMAANKLSSAYELGTNVWARNQRAENAKLDVAENMNLNYQKAYQYGQTGNYEMALADLDISHKQLENFGFSALGATGTRKFLEDYRTDYVKNFISGQMMTDPESAILALDNEKIRKTIGDPRQIEDLRGFALAKFETLKRINEGKRIAEDIKRGSGLLNASVNGSLSLEKIEANLPENASETYKNLIYSLNGFRRKTGKLTTDEKAKISLEVYDQMNRVLADPKASPEDFAAVQENLYKAMESGAMNKAEGMNVLNKIYEPLQKSWAERLSPYSEDNWFSADHGAALVQKFVEDNYIASPDKKDRLKRNIESANNKARADGYRLYYDYLQQEVMKYPEYESIADVLTESDAAKKNKILDAAAEQTKQNFNQRRFERLKSIKPEQQPNAVLDGNMLTENSGRIENSKQGLPVKSGIVTIGKYQIEVEK